MGKNGPLDIICRIFGVIFSILLVVSIILTVVAGALTNLVKADTLAEMVTDVDVSGMITENVDMSQLTEEMGIPEEKVQEVMESQLVKDIVSEYAEGITGALTGNADDITVEDIKAIVDANREDILDFVLENTEGDDVNVSEISHQLDALLDETAEEIVNGMPQPSTMVEQIPPDVAKALEIISSGTLLKACILVVAALAVIIFLLRLWDFAGFKWLSVNGIISGILVAVVYGALTVGKGYVGMLFEKYEAGAGVIINFASQTLLISFISLFVVSAVLMIIYKVIKRIRE